MGEIVVLYGTGGFDSGCWRRGDGALRFIFAGGTHAVTKAVGGSVCCWRRDDGALRFVFAGRTHAITKAVGGSVCLLAPW